VTYAKYKNHLDSLNPVAIKLGQTEIHAPQHDTWGILTCDICGEKFALGPNRIYGSRANEATCVKELESLLIRDHKRNQSHQNSYDLRE
jgi:hypothetical protein